MMVPRLTAAAALLAMGACQQATGPTPEYRPEEAGTVDHAMCLLGFTAVPLRSVSPGHHLVEAVINGRRASFVLDTGANVTVISEGKAKDFGLSGSSGSFAGLGKVFGPGEGAGARQVAIETMTIGSLEIGQQRVVTADLGNLLTSFGQISGEDVAGLIGQDVLNTHRAVIDVAKPMLYLQPEGREPAPVPADRCREPERNPPGSPAANP